MIPSVDVADGLHREGPVAEDRDVGALVPVQRSASREVGKRGESVAWIDADEVVRTPEFGRDGGITIVDVLLEECTGEISMIRSHTERRAIGLDICTDGDSRFGNIWG